MPKVAVTVSAEIAKGYGSRNRAGYTFTRKPIVFDAEKLPAAVAADRELIKKLIADPAPVVETVKLVETVVDGDPVDGDPAVVLIGDPGDETPLPADDPPQVDLSTLNVEELRGLARDQGLPVRGTKAELLARLTEALAMKADRMQDA